MSTLRVDSIEQVNGDPISAIKPTIMAEQSVSGLTSAEFLDIPSWAKEIKVMLRSVSSSGANNFLVQLGTSSGFITASQYNSISFSANGASNATQTIGFIILQPSGGTPTRGVMTISKFSETINTYVETGMFMRDTVSGSYCAGDLNGFTGVIDRVRVNTTGASTFASGRICVMYS